VATSVFTLEALEAKHGDSLLLHYGPLTSPRLIVIDGGPAGVYKKSLRPRLHEIRTNRGGSELEIRMLMVSHIDDDHIAGVLDFSTELRQDADAKKTLPFNILTLWHNSFDDIIAKLGQSAGEVLKARFKGKQTADAAAIVAGVKQGRQLRLDADALAINMNSGFDDLIQFDKSAKALKMGAGLTFTVLGPRKAELDALESKWQRDLKTILKKHKTTEAAAAEFLDESVHNLSSVIVLAEFDGQRMLLTGDARGDFILDSLREAGLLTGGHIDVDILKMPHHGSRRNVSVDFFKAVRARHYVASANGRDDNPDPPTFTDLFKARPKGPYDIWLTNDVAPAVKVIKAKKPAGVTLHLPKKAGDPLRIELASAIKW
jgi:hypothetical protein